MKANDERTAPDGFEWACIRRWGTLPHDASDIRDVARYFYDAALAHAAERQREDEALLREIKDALWNQKIKHEGDDRAWNARLIWCYEAVEARLAKAQSMTNAPSASICPACERDEHEKCVSFMCDCNCRRPKRNDAPSASEQQTWRREHDKRGGGDVREYCSECLGDWPCPTIRLLDALEASEQREARLREKYEALCRYRERVEGLPEGALGGLS